MACRDVEAIASNGNMDVVGTELAVAVMLSSLVRRGVCPNFILTRGVFSCPYEPPASYWGSAEDKCPQGGAYVPPKSNRRKQREPKQQGQYQYIRMELCDEGDVEEYLKRQPDEAIPPDQARQILFQISFALHAAADRFSMKHYDVKLLNVFLKRPCPSSSSDVVMRYGLGAHKFALRAPAARALVAKLADYGTANVEAQSSGQPVTIAQFTTLENTPPEFLVLGDLACQGHGHDCFGLGLCMLHLFTGHAPYEEILEDVTCPVNLRRKLRKLWEDEHVTEFSVVRSIVLQEVFKDEDGHILEGDPDETLYDTIYRYLVIFGVPEAIPNSMGAKVFLAIKEALDGSHGSRAKGGKCGKGKNGLTDVIRFSRDRKKFSLSHGNNKFMARARASLEVSHGGVFSIIFRR
jgi:serine/threonine protein kinase